MKKQYNYQETASFRYILNIYHDGQLVDSQKYWEDELYDKSKQLEEQGYVYGYTNEQIEKTKRIYEHMLENRL